MAILTRADMLAKLKERIGNDTSDEALQLIEDVTDTIDNYENNSNEDWKKKYEDNDNMWRNKYKERFFGKKENTDESIYDDNDDDKDIKTENLTYENLFKNGD